MPLQNPTQIHRAPLSTTSATATTAQINPLTFHSHTHSMPLSTSAPKVGRVGKWYLPAMGLVAAGYAAANYTSQKMADSKAEEERRRLERARQMAMMEAYGDGHDMESLRKAMEVYEVQ